MKVYKIQVILFFLFIQIFILPQSDTIRFAWMSDVHIGNPTAAEDLRNSVKDINSLNGIDFTIISGDIAEMGTNDQLKLAKQILDSLKETYYIIPGNHDFKWSESGATLFPKLWGDDKFIFTYRDYLFIGLAQGPIMKMGDGHWNPQDLRWLDSALQNVSKKRRIFFVTHYPIDNSIDNWYEVLDRMKNFNIQAFLFGHGHRNKTYNFEGIPGVMSRSNLRAEDSIGGYIVAEIAEDTIKFYEKTPLTNKKRYWAEVPVGEHHYDNSVKEERPEFSINKSYSQVKEEWIYNAGFTNGSSPALWKNFVFAGDESGFIRKLSLDNGNVIDSFPKGMSEWTPLEDSHKTKGPIYSTPAIKNNNIVFGSADSNVYCIDPEKCKLKWKVKTGAEVLGSPSIDNNIVYIGGSDRIFRAIDLNTGKVLWEFDNLNGFVETKPLVYKDKVIFGAWDTYLYCLNKSTGELLWKWKGDKEGLLYSPAAFWPVAADDIVFIAAPDRKLTAVDINSGKQLWRTSEYQVRESIGIAGDGSNFFVRTMSDSIIAFPVSDTLPKPVWITNAGFGYDINSAQLEEKDGVLFYGTKNGLLLALDSSTGKILWEHKVGVTIINTVTPLDSNHVLLNDLDGRTMLIESK